MKLPNIKGYKPSSLTNGDILYKKDSVIHKKDHIIYVPDSINLILVEGKIVFTLNKHQYIIPKVSKDNTILYNIKNINELKCTRLVNIIYKPKLVKYKLDNLKVGDIIFIEHVSNETLDQQLNYYMLLSDKETILTTKNNSIYLSNIRDCIFTLNTIWHTDFVYKVAL